MFIYFAILIFVSIFSFGVSYSKDISLEVVFRILSFLALFIPMAIRDGIGVDTPGYMDMFYNICNGNFSNVEKGWIYLNKFIYLLGGNAQLFLAFISFISLFFLFEEIEKKQWVIYGPICVLILYTWLFTTLRQMLAMCMFFNVLLKWKKNKKKRGLFLFIISYFIHKSVLIYVPFLFFARFIKLSKKTNLVSFVGIIIFSRYIFPYLLDVFFYLVGLSQFSVYLFATKYTEGTIVGSGLGRLMRHFILFLLLYNLPTKDESYSRLSFTFLLVILFDYLTDVVKLIDRLRRGFLFIFFPMGWSSLQYNSGVKLYIYLLCYLVLFLLDLKGGFHGALPYRSILF